MSIYEDVQVMVSGLTWFDSNNLYRDGLPDGFGDAASVDVVSGGGYERTHGVQHGWLEYIIEFRVRASVPATARSRVASLVTELNGKVNVTYNGTRYRSLFASTAPVLVERTGDGISTYLIGFAMMRNEGG